MGTIVADSSGNWSATGTWAGDAKPGVGDTAQTGAYTVTIDENVTCTQIEATSTGHFEVTTGGITINANVVMNSTYADNGGVRCTHNTGTVTINGDITATFAAATYHAVCNNGTGTLTISSATITGSNANAVRNVSSGTVNITVTSITPPLVSNRYTLYNASTGPMNVTGSPLGGAGSSRYGLGNGSTGTVTITGNSTGGTNFETYGSRNLAAGTINVSGTVTGGSGEYAAGLANDGAGTVTCDTAVGGTAYWSPGLLGIANNGTTTYKRIGVQTNGNTAIMGFCKMALDADYNVIVVKDGSSNDVSMSNDYPAVTDVKDGVFYNRTTLEGTLEEWGLPDAQYILEAGGGNYHAPSVGEVLDSAVFGSNSGTSGTYHAPLAAEVIDSAVFGISSGTSGTVHLPDAGEVIDTADFGPASGTAGTFAIPPEAKVEDGYGYGAGGTEFEGELVASSGGGVTIEALSAELGVG